MERGQIFPSSRKPCNIEEINLSFGKYPSNWYRQELSMDVKKFDENQDIYIISSYLPKNNKTTANFISKWKKELSFKWKITTDVTLMKWSN